MKSFKFSLERIQNYKTQVLDKEKKTLAIFIRQRDEIDFKITCTENFRDEKMSEAYEKQCCGVCVSELVSFSYLIESARRQIKILQIELQKAEEIVDIQRQVVLDVYQEKTGMDKLEEKQLEEHRLLEAKEIENEIMQVISNNMADKNSANKMNAGIA